MRRRLYCATIAVGGALLAPASAVAATYTVTSNADGAPNATNCTAPGVNTCRLRDAVEAANDGAGSDDVIDIQQGLIIAPGAGQDDTNVAGDLDIQTGPNNGSLLIEGLGTGATVFAPPLDRVIDNQGANSSPVTVQNLFFVNGTAQMGAGNDGGSIRLRAAAGNLSVDGVGFTTSTAAGTGGAIHVTSSVLNQTTTVTDTDFSSTGGSIGGGAIRSNRAVAVTGSRFDQAGNNGSTFRGGSILLDGATATGIVDRSSFVSGRAAVGGVFAVISGASLLVTNSTVGENTAALGGGGAVSVRDAGSNTTFANVTFSDNSAAASGAATFDINNSAAAADQTVANSIVETDDADSPNCSLNDLAAPAFTSGGHNIQFRNTAGDTACATTPGSGDLMGDPMLPATFASFPVPNQNGYLPAAGSPAIDGGANCEARAGTLDQLGAARTQGTACDVGAIEQAGPPAAAAAGDGGTTSPSPTGTTLDPCPPLRKKLRKAKRAHNRPKVRKLKKKLRKLGC